MRDKSSVIAYQSVRALMLWLIIRQLRSRNAAARRLAAEQLLQSPRRGAFKALRAALQDEDTQVRMTAALAMGKLEIEECGEPLISVLQDREVEDGACLALFVENRPDIPAGTVEGALEGFLRLPDLPAT